MAAASDAVAGRDRHALRVLAIGAAAFGAAAVGALAVGALAIGRLAIGRARIRRLELGELDVAALRVASRPLPELIGAPVAALQPAAPSPKRRAGGRRSERREA